ncbi:MAG: 50S ribosomal protein L19 [Phycisphaeraceae bacterium]|nr:50S ribosomal protein L19 [Phycisphaeraceae bacterium]
MSHPIIEQLEQSQLRTDLPEINPGDTIDVHYRIIEGSKERIQIFSGVVLKKENRGLNSNITVRRIVANEGVERIFPLHSPKISKIEIKRHGDARRAKLYFLRDRVGKSRRLRDRRRGLQHALVVTGSQKTAKAEAIAQAKAAAAAK